MNIPAASAAYPPHEHATGGQYLNPDKNLVIDNALDTTNLSSTINVSNISVDLITSKMLNSVHLLLVIMPTFLTDIILII